MAVYQDPSTIISSAPEGTLTVSDGTLGVTLGLPPTVLAANVNIAYTTNQYSTVYNRPGGNTYDVQFKSSDGDFDGDADLTYNPNTNDLSIRGIIRGDKFLYSNGLSVGTFVAGTGLNLSGIVFSIANTAVSAGNYGNATHSPTFTVDAQGRLTAANTVAMTPNAANLTGTTLSTTVVNSSLTSVGTLTTLGVSGTATASRLVSNVATGTAPLTVTSTTRVANLNVAYANVTDFSVVTNQTTGTFYPTFVTGSATANYALNANGAVSFDAATGTWTSNVISANGTAASTSTTTGALLSAGGAGIAGNLYVGGNADITGTVTANKAIIQKYAAAAGTTIDASSAGYFSVSGSLGLTVTNVAAAGLVTSFVLEVTNGIGPLTIGGSNPLWSGGTAYTPTASGTDILSFYTYDGGTTWRGVILSLDNK